MAPLALMHHKDVRLNQLLRTYIDGIPLDLASSLLPGKTRAMFSILSHIHAHAKSQKKYEGKQENVKERKMSKRSLEGIVESLRSGVSKMSWKLADTEWGDYYSDTNYSEESFTHKKQIIEKHISKIKPNMVWDLGMQVIGLIVHLCDASMLVGHKMLAKLSVCLPYLSFFVFLK